MVATSIVYVAISLLSKKKDFNLEKMLHRGKYKIEGEHTYRIEQPNKYLKLFGIGKEFSKKDIIVYFGTYLWIFLGVFVFIFGSIYYAIYGIPDSGWMMFWYSYLIIYTILAILVIVWLLFGGIGDLKDMFRRLKTMKRDASDNGVVRSGDYNE
jgi:SSS family solute:Na+ symporter